MAVSHGNATTDESIVVSFSAKSIFGTSKTFAAPFTQDEMRLVKTKDEAGVTGQSAHAVKAPWSVPPQTKNSVRQMLAGQCAQLNQRAVAQTAGNATGTSCEFTQGEPSSSLWMATILYGGFRCRSLLLVY
jgi:hypothetical protein